MGGGGGGVHVAVATGSPARRARVFNSVTDKNVSSFGTLSKKHIKMVTRVVAPLLLLRGGWRWSATTGRRDPAWWWWEEQGQVFVVGRRRRAGGGDDATEGLLGGASKTRRAVLGASNKLVVVVVRLGPADGSSANFFWDEACWGISSSNLGVSFRIWDT